MVSHLALRTKGKLHQFLRYFLGNWSQLKLKKSIEEVKRGKNIPTELNPNEKKSYYLTDRIIKPQKKDSGITVHFCTHIARMFFFAAMCVCTLL